MHVVAPPTISNGISGTKRCWCWDSVTPGCRWRAGSRAAAPAYASPTPVRHRRTRQRFARELPDVPLDDGRFHAARCSRRRRDRDQPGRATAVSRSSTTRHRARRARASATSNFRAARRVHASRSLRPKVLAITGSNGKSTVTAMAGAMCRAAGCARWSPATSACLCSMRCRDRSELAPSADTRLRARAVELPARDARRASSARRRDDAQRHRRPSRPLRRLADYAAAKARIFHGSGVQVLNRDDRWSLQHGARRPHRPSPSARDAPIARARLGHCCTRRRDVARAGHASS